MKVFQDTGSGVFRVWRKPLEHLGQKRKELLRKGPGFDVLSAICVEIGCRSLHWGLQGGRASQDVRRSWAASGSNQSVTP